jgi:histidine triad (HIT) family protein
MLLGLRPVPKQKPGNQTLLVETKGLSVQLKPGEQCAFCQIVNQKTASRIVFRDEISTAFLDRRPLFLGHSLLVPNKHYTNISELPSGIVGPFFENVRLLTAAVEKGMHADGSFLAINNKISQSVPHLHVHVVPRRSGDGLRGFFFPRQNYANAEEEARIQRTIMQAISDVQSAHD